MPGVPPAGAAEALPFADGSLDAITVAQAFHWFDADRGAARSSIACCGRADGSRLVWNARDRSVPWVDEVWSIMDRVEKRAPWRDHDEWRESAFVRDSRGSVRCTRRRSTTSSSSHPRRGRRPRAQREPRRGAATRAAGARCSTRCVRCCVTTPRLRVATRSRSPTGSTRTGPSGPDHGAVDVRVHGAEPRARPTAVFEVLADATRWQDWAGPTIARVGMGPRGRCRHPAASVRCASSAAGRASPASRSPSTTRRVTSPTRSSRASRARLPRRHRPLPRRRPAATIRWAGAFEPKVPGTGTGSQAGARADRPSASHTHAAREANAAAPQSALITRATPAKGSDVFQI